MPINATPFDSFAATHLPAIESALDHCSAGDGDAPLIEAMRYSLLMPGKRIRPLLTLMAADACGGDVKAALPAACAVEMIHAFSLVHDDLPAMDNDDLRRGKPTNHKVYGEAMAILAGDALLALAFETVLQLPAQIAHRCALELARATGRNGMTGGQAVDIRGLGAKAEIGDVHELHARKTGALFLAAVRMGAFVANASEDKLQALTRYSEGLGAAFQITDDLLDVTGSRESMGKTAGKDVKQGKVTYPSLLGVDASKKAAREVVNDAVGALLPFNKKAEHLVDLAGYILARKK